MTAAGTCPDSNFIDEDENTSIGSKSSPYVIKRHGFAQTEFFDDDVDDMGIDIDSSVHSKRSSSTELETREESETLL